MSWQTAIAITSLLWITVPLPAGYDKKNDSVSASTVKLCCKFRARRCEDLSSAEGNILQLLDKRLFVDEACSGVDSLYALMAISLTLVLFMKQRFLVALCALSMVIVWASCGNILRLVLIVFGLQWVGIDLSSGTPHTILGLCVFLRSIRMRFRFYSVSWSACAPILKPSANRRQLLKEGCNRRLKLPRPLRSARWLWPFRFHVFCVSSPWGRIPRKCLAGERFSFSRIHGVIPSKAKRLVGNARSTRYLEFGEDGVG